MSYERYTDTFDPSRLWWSIRSLPEQAMTALLCHIVAASVIFAMLEGIGCKDSLRSRLEGKLLATMLCLLTKWFGKQLEETGTKA